MGWGDELMAAGQARAEHLRTGRRIAICGSDGKPRWHELWEGLDFIARPGEWSGAQYVSQPGSFESEPLRIVNGPGARPYHERPLKVSEGWRWTGWRVRDNRPVLVLRSYESEVGAKWRALLGPFVVIAPHAKPIYPNKSWGFERFQAVVDALPDVPFLQVEEPNGKFLKGVHGCYPFSFRGACGLISGAALFLGNQGGLVHAAAALGVRAVVIFGGAEPPELMGYPENINLTGGAPEPACGRILACDHCKRAMAEITPEAGAAHIRAALEARAALKTGAA